MKLEKPTGHFVDIPIARRTRENEVSGFLELFDYRF
jgi:hypothetical protein